MVFDISARVFPVESPLCRPDPNGSRLARKNVFGTSIQPVRHLVLVDVSSLPHVGGGIDEDYPSFIHILHALGE